MEILLTKVRVPHRRKDTLRRVRLIDFLHQNTLRKLTFVSAPAGFGKTTLLSDFASDVAAKVCWYQISPEDNDLIPFLSHLIASFRQLFPAFGSGLEETLGAGGNPDPHSMATEVINQIEKYVDDFCIVVLDDYHLVGESDSIVSFIDSLLEYLPDQVRLLIGSRSVYGIPTANLYVREELGTLSADDLRFRADELQTLVLQNYHVKLSDEQAHELAKRADGWILAMLLAIRTMDHGALPKFEGAIDQIYEFLAKDVIDRQPENLRAFMLDTSVVDEFNESLCEFLLETNEIHHLLEALEARNLFVTRVQTGEGITYRYHQLFAEFLRSQLTQENPEREISLHSKAASWYQQNNAWELAIRHKLSAGEREQAAVWMDETAEEFFVSGRYNLLSYWYEALLAPTDLRSLTPRLLLALVKLRNNQDDYEAAEELLDIVEGSFAQQLDVQQIANAKIQRGFQRRVQGRFSEAVELSISAQQYMIDHDMDIQQSEPWHVAERVKGSALQYLGESEKAIEHLSTAIDFFESKSNNKKADQYASTKYILAESLNDLGMVHYSQGDLYEAQKCFSRALDLQQKLRSNRGVIALALNNVGYLHYEAGHYPEAWNYYEESLESVAKSQFWRILILVLNSRGDLLRDVGEHDESEKSYRNAIAIGDRENLQRYLFDSYAGLSIIERVRGNFSESNHWIREMARIRGDSLDLPIYQLYQGWLYLDMGQLDLASACLNRAYQHDEKPQKEKVLAAYLLGKTYFLLNQETKALAAVNDALLWTAQLGFNQFLVVAAKEDEEFLAFAMAAASSSQLESFVKQVDNLQLGLSAIQKKPHVVEALHTHLEIEAFGYGRVRKNGELLSNSVWRSTGARALFFYIIDQKGIRKDDIALEFWPQFSASKVSSNFHATLWRVRSALGHRDLIIYEDGLYKVNPDISIWYDVEEFSRQVDLAQDPSLPKTERASLWRSAIGLVSGDFLEDIFMDWSDGRRAELLERVTLVLGELARWNYSLKRYEKAKSLYERILAKNPYQDQIHLDLMKCLVAQGEATAAKAHYKAYSALLFNELQTQPVVALREYYEKLA